MTREEWFKSELLAGMFLVALATNFGRQGKLETMASSLRIEFEAKSKEDAQRIAYFAMGMREAFGLLSEVK